MLVHIKEIVKDASSKGYILGAFNIHNLETALGVAQAAEEIKSPAIIQVSESSIKYIGLSMVVAMVKILATGEAKSVPIALHLDHGKSLDVIKECVVAGFSSVHRDASAMPLPQNIAETKAAVKWARPKGVWVQGEVGMIIGGHGAKGSLGEKIPLTNPKDVKIFLQETDVDTIATAVGTAHGIFSEEHVDIDLIKQIKKIVKNTPLVMHGGSGLSDEELADARTAGINITNIGSHIKESFTQAVIKTALADVQENDPRRILTPGIIAVKNIAMEKMQVLGSANKA